MNELQQNSYYLELTEAGYSIFMEELKDRVVVQMKRGDVMSRLTEWPKFMPVAAFEAILMHQRRAIDIHSGIV